MLLELALASFTMPCTASEEGLGAYWPGYRNYLAGVVPSEPGVYLREDVIGYTASAPKLVSNGQPIGGSSSGMATGIVEPWFVTNHKIWGATHAVVLIVPLAWGEARGNVIGTNINPSGTNFQVGDIVVSPLFLGWERGKLHYNSSLFIFVPTGPYDIHRVVNTGLNYWTVDPEFGFTYLNPKTGWDLSGALGYSLNTENTATHYTSGDILHLDLAAGRMFKNGFKPGIVGYAWIQVTGDSGPGALFGSFESRVFGLGPALEWKTSKRSRLMFRCGFEFGANDRLQGNQYALTLRTQL